MCNDRSGKITVTVLRSRASDSKGQERGSLVCLVSILFGGSRCSVQYSTSTWFGHHSLRPHWYSHVMNRTLPWPSRTSRLFVFKFSNTVIVHGYCKTTELHRFNWHRLGYKMSSHDPCWSSQVPYSLSCVYLSIFTKHHDLHISRTAQRNGSFPFCCPLVPRPSLLAQRGSPYCQCQQ